MIRTLWVFTVGSILTLFHAGRIVVCNRMGCSGVSDLCSHSGRAWARAILRMAGAKVRMSGLEQVDWSRPLVIVANHQSWFDVFALTAHLPVTGRFVAKEELGRIPIFGAAWKACGHIEIDRSDRRQSIDSLDRAALRVRDESLAMILFPEGTRSKDGALQPFKKGAFVLAIKAGVPVIPVGISGSRQIMAKGSFRIRPGFIGVHVGKPIEVEGLGHQDRDELLRKSHAAVASLMEDAESDINHQRENTA